MRRVNYKRNNPAALGLPDFDALHPEHEIAQEVQKLLGETVEGDLLRACRHDPSSRATTNAACAYCRTKLILQNAERMPRLAYDHRLRGAHFTVLSQDLPDLRDIHLPDLLKQAKGQLKLASRELHLKHLFAIGAVEVVPKLILKAKPKTTLWSFHLHVVILCRSPKLLVDYLKPLSINAPSDQLPVMCTPSLCLGRHVSYALKMRPSMLVPAVDHRGNSTYTSAPMTKGQKRQLYTWLASHLLRDVVFSLSIEPKH